MAGRARRLDLPFLVSAAAAVGFLALYGWRVIQDVPWLDDWWFIRHLERHLAGESSIGGYLFARHNEHLVVPARLAFLLVYHACGLDLALVRWLTVAVYAGTALAMTVVLRRDLAASAQTLGLLRWGPVLAMTTCLQSWETVSTAMTFSNAVFLAGACGAVVAFDRWRRSGSLSALSATFLLALLAQASSAAGPLVTLLLAVAAALCFRFATRRIATMALWVLGLGSLWAQLQLPATGPAAGPPAWDTFAIGVAVVAGVPLGWQSGGRPMMAETAMVGAVFWAGFAAALLAAARRRLALPAPWAKYLMLSGIGAVTALSIAWARQRTGSLEALAASRFFPFVAPLALGVHGFWAVACATDRPRRSAAAGAVLLACVLVADVAEYRMWRGHADAYRALRRLLLEGDAANIAPERLQTYLRGGPEIAQVAHDVIPFLRDGRLTLFR